MTDQTPPYPPSPTSDLDLELARGMDAGPDGKAPKPDPEHEPASERVREAWGSLPGEEQYVGAEVHSLPLPTGFDEIVTEDRLHVVSIDISLGGRNFSVSDNWSGEFNMSQILESLDRLNSSVLSWLEMRQHQRDHH